MTGALCRVAPFVRPHTELVVKWYSIQRINLPRSHTLPGGSVVEKRTLESIQTITTQQYINTESENLQLLSEFDGSCVFDAYYLVE